MPPFVARGGYLVTVLALLVGSALGAACSSSAASTRSTPGSTALAIPPPFEVGQQVGTGDLTILVDSFRRAGDSVSAHVEIANQSGRSVALVGARVFSIFYETGRHSPSHVAGLASPIAPHGRASVTLEFAVPAKYEFPLLWFDAGGPATHGTTIVLRGDHA